MAVIRLTTGADPIRCPTCGGEMSIAKKGRRPATAHLWFRICRDLARCGITTVTEEAPACAITTTPAPVYLPGSLPLERVTREDMERVIERGQR